MKKKVPWRQGIVVSVEGEPDKPATEDMAKRYNRLARREKDPRRREGYRFAAQVVSALGAANEQMVDLNTYRPGRPKGSRLGSLDAPLQAFMEKTSAATGEIRKFTLARLAVEHFGIPKEGRENTKHRLARWWTGRD